MGELLKTVITYGDRISSFVMLILIVVALGYIVIGFATGKIASPGETKRLAKRLEETETALGLVTESLTESKALHAGALVRIEFLERDLERRDRDVAGVNLRCTRLETELEVLRREHWSRGSSDH